MQKAVITFIVSEHLSRHSKVKAIHQTHFSCA